MTALTPQTVFLEHESWLRTVVRSRLNEPDAVEDVMQNIAMAIVRQRSGLSEINRIGAWLYQTAIRQVLMHRRTAGRFRKMQERRAVEAPASIEATSPLQGLLTEESSRNLHVALGELQEIERQILMLKYAEGWTYRELADHLGVREDTIEYRLLRARRNLRRELLQLGEEGGT